MSEELLQAASRRFDHAEVYRVESSSQPVSFEANRLKEVSRSDVSGVALRAIKDGRVGFSSTTDPTGETALMDRVAGVLSFGPEAEFSFPGETAFPDVAVYDPAVEELSFEEMVETGQTLIDRVRAGWPDVLCQAGVSTAVGATEIANSNGGGGRYKSTSYSVGVGGMLVRGTDMLFVWDGFSSARVQDESARLVQSVLEQLEHARHTAEAPAGEPPVIFTPRGFVATLLGPLLQGLDGKNVANGTSPLAGRRGERVVDERVCVRDDPTLAYAAGSRPYDDEGTPSRRVTLFEHGAVTEFLLDLQTAGRLGERSTGSAHRSVGSLPAPGSSVIDVAAGDTPYVDLFTGIKTGLVVEQLLGAGQGNELGGDFKANVLLGYRIENGRIAGRVKDTVISGNVYDVLSSIEAISSEPEWVYGLARAPAFRCLGVEVASTGG